MSEYEGGRLQTLIFHSTTFGNVHLDHYIRICFCQNQEFKLANLISGHSTREHFFTANQNTATSSHKDSAIAARSHGSCDAQISDKKNMLCSFTCPIFQISSENH